MSARPRILSLADFLATQPSPPARPAQAQRPSKRLSRQQVTLPKPEQDPSGSEFPHRGLLRRDQAHHAQPIELSQEVWTQEDEVLRLPPEADQVAPNEPETDQKVDEAALRAAIEAEWQKRLQEATARARAEGETVGRHAAEAEWAPRLQALQEQLALELERLRRAWAEYTRQLEPMLVELAIEVAETLLDAPLPESIKGISARALTEAIEQLAREAPLEISMHPVDFLRLQEQGVISQLESRHPELHWDLNPGLNEGDWIVQTPAAMQRRIRQEMLQRLRQQLGLTSPDASATSHSSSSPDDENA